MAELRGWQAHRENWVRLLEESTGLGLEAWSARIHRAQIDEAQLNSEQSLREWLTRQGVTGYAQTLLVMEHLGYPEYMTATADQLIEGQYADREGLRPIYEAILDVVIEFGEVVLQARKTYVSLVTPRRTFARIQPTTRTRLDLGLRLSGQASGGRLQPSRIHPTMPVQVSLTSANQVDDEVRGWLRLAYDQNC